jgi:2'-5' RNA ligase superfamily
LRAPTKAEGLDRPPLEVQHRLLRGFPGQLAPPVLASCGMGSPDAESVLLVEVPAAEAAVGLHRAHLDANASLGIPAHITVLSPFMPPQMISPLVLAELERMFASIKRLRFQLAATDWFGEEVLLLALTDPAPFRALTDGVYKAFPAFPPFEGKHDVLIPHRRSRPSGERAAGRREVRPSAVAY